MSDDSDPHGTRLIELELAAMRVLLPRMMLAQGSPHLEEFLMNEESLLAAVRTVAHDRGEISFVLRYVLCVLGEQRDLLFEAGLPQDQPKRLGTPALRLVSPAPQSTREGNDAPSDEELQWRAATANQEFRIVALEFLVTRLLASHAEMFNDGFGRRVLESPDAELETFESPEIHPAASTQMAACLRLIVHNARMALQQAGRFTLRG